MRIQIKVPHLIIIIITNQINPGMIILLVSYVVRRIIIDPNVHRMWISQPRSWKQKRLLLKEVITWSYLKILHKKLMMMNTFKVVQD